MCNHKSRRLLINLENPNSLCKDHDKRTQGNIRRPTSGRPRKTNERDDRHLYQLSKGDVRLTAPQITSKYKLRKDVYVTTIHLEVVLVENH